jgi:FtsP/CotA-like multicopper oxidase with cupredoxin domain
MHSHHELQEQLLLAAPLIVRTEEDLRSDAQDVTVLLHDFTFRDPAEILAQLTGRGTTAQNRTTLQPPHADTMGQHSMEMHGVATNGHGPMPMVPTPAGPGTSKTGMVVDLNDIDFDAYLANDRTLGDPLVVHAERSGRVRLRLINGATSTAFWVDLGPLTGTVIAVDGDPVRPVPVRRFPMAEAQRVDVVLQLPRNGGAFPVLAQREGDRQRTGIVLATPNARITKLSNLVSDAVRPADLSLERSLEAAQPLVMRRPDIVHSVALTGTMMPYRWSINNRTWADHQPLVVKQGQRVELEIINQTQMAHPMHLHGHHFQVVALNGSPVRGPMRDTVFVPANGSVRIAFDADNPGRWLFHCHNLYHMATGMMTEVAYDHVA